MNKPAASIPSSPPSPGSPCSHPSVSSASIQRLCNCPPEGSEATSHGRSSLGHPQPCGEHRLQRRWIAALLAAPHHIDRHLSSSGNNRGGHALIHQAALAKAPTDPAISSSESTQRNQLWVRIGYRVIPVSYDMGSRPLRGIY